mgnify:CR=1 FL=1
MCKSIVLKPFVTVFIILIAQGAIAQNALRPIDQLVTTSNSAWPLVQQWISKAKNKVEVLSSDPDKAKDALYKTQVTTRSPMGAIIYSSGGLLIDGGWIRVLGSGHEKLNRTLPDWNKGKSFNEFGEQPSFLLVADDAAGGFFAINAGAFGADMGKIYYLSPDDLEWSPLDLTYTDFLDFCFMGNLAEFYKDLRWKDWENEVKKLDGNMIFNFFPYLWTKEGKDINAVSRKQVPVGEQFNFTMEMRKQLGF